MKNFLIAFGVFIVWSVFGLWIFSLIQPVKYAVVLETEVNETMQIDTRFTEDISNKGNDSVTKGSETINTANESDSPVKKKAENLKGLKTINQYGTIVFIFKDAISFKKNTSTLIIPLAVANYNIKLKNILRDNPEQELHISSIYSPMETVQLPNLSIQQASEISKTTY